MIGPRNCVTPSPPKKLQYALEFKIFSVWTNHDSLLFWTVFRTTIFLPHKQWVLLLTALEHIGRELHGKSAAWKLWSIFEASSRIYFTLRAPMHTFKFRNSVGFALGIASGFCTCLSWTSSLGCPLISSRVVVKQTVLILKAAHTSFPGVTHATLAQSTTPPLCSPGLESKERKEAKSLHWVQAQL